MSERTHRHQLEKNLLADWLAEKYELFKPYGTHIAVGSLVVVAALVGGIYYLTRSDTVTPRAWQSYFSAFGEQKVADALKDAFETPEVEGTAAELWARLSYADQRFQFAAMQGGQDSQEAKTALADAEKALTEIVDETSDPLLLARIRFSLARIYESQLKPNKAREYYKQIVDAGKDTALGKRSAEALKRLAPDGEATAVLAWLAEQKPLPRSTPGGSPFLDGMGGGFGSPFGGGPQPTLPERPNLNLPGAESPFSPSGPGDIDFGRDDPAGAKGTQPEGTAPDPNPPQTNEPGKDEPVKNEPDTKSDGTEKDAESASADDKQSP